MAWRDIDVHMVLEPDPVELRQYWKMGMQISQLDGVYHCDFLNTHRHRRENLPIGFYWGIKHDNGAGNISKIDIWATDTADLERNRALMERVANTLTDGTRA